MVFSKVVSRLGRLFTSTEYSAATPWTPGLALVFGIALSATYLAMSGFLAPLGVSGGGDAAGRSDHVVPVLLQCILAAMASVVIWHCSARSNGARQRALNLAPSKLSRDAVLSITGVLTTAALSLNILLRFLMGEPALFSPPASLPELLLSGLLLVVFLPVLEEFLFRGFLLSALSQSALGFWPSALIVNTLWAALHVNIPLEGRFVIWLLGLVLSLALWRTGSLIVSIAIHSAYNLYWAALLAAGYFLL